MEIVIISKIHLGFYQSGRYPNFSANEWSKISSNEKGPWKSLKCFNFTFIWLMRHCSLIRVCFNNSWNTTEQYYILTWHFGYIEHLGCNLGSGTTLVVTVLIAPQQNTHLYSHKVYITSHIYYNHTEQMYFLACRYTCATYYLDIITLLMYLFFLK